MVIIDRFVINQKQYLVFKLNVSRPIGVGMTATKTAKHKKVHY